MTERYRILRKLGEGGFGRTYLVRDRKLGKLWAMKEWKENEGSMEEEFRILREMESPCFPRLVEYFRENGKQYLVMDWIRGMTLEEKLLKDGPLPWRAAAGYALQLCGALEKLHGGKPSILHLDLKPSNIILTQDGPRLIDFGSAVLETEVGKKDGKDRPAAGTPGYAPPELATQEVDVRSDVYGLGAVLRVMLDGGKGDGIPEPLWEIVDRALQEKKEERFGNVREMRLALETLLKEESEEEKKKMFRAEKERAFGRTAACLTAAAAFLAAFLWFFALQPQVPSMSGAWEAGSVRKEFICSGKRREILSDTSLWELMYQGEGEKKIFGIRHFLGEALKKTVR
ncbi:MAG TPA: serine/threonine protein kinase [Candidatus Eisenbergiella merdipullorum]|uniref:non-specific serine/threonine protein kinase n=1 Tax=Candidatus Eisenbergiella merdipullorum TaxID=2838553 RepID=A0A9D2L131_9FIRM|nr:serine/threonine protein kinase [Candidatus Eisenbergiella merdipullorum]